MKTMTKKSAFCASLVVSKRAEPGSAAQSIEENDQVMKNTAA